ncbi:hypothetical protein F5Y11DRAFT_281643 [Daldinia sp. FL1419]|nr:hypothetical protein F5Y11DRAFT_281643 [Daldinia sp. FL1419]
MEIMVFFFYFNFLVTLLAAYCTSFIEYMLESSPRRRSSTPQVAVSILFRLLNHLPNSPIEQRRYVRAYVCMYVCRQVGMLLDDVYTYIRWYGVGSFRRPRTLDGTGARKRVDRGIASGYLGHFARPWGPPRG